MPSEFTTKIMSEKSSHMSTKYFNTGANQFRNPLITNKGKYRKFMSEMHETDNI